MTNTNSFNARSILVLTSLSAVLLLGACGVPQDKGYYNENGRFVRTDTPHNMTKREHVAREVFDNDDHANRNDYNNNERNRDRYYDRQGYSVEDRGMSGNIVVPASMVPPRGMCRVWFTSRVATDQPSPEPCNNIKSRVPVGAFVVYGG